MPLSQLSQECYKKYFANETVNLWKTYYWTFLNDQIFDY